MWGNAYLTLKKCKSFQGPKVGPGPRPMSMLTFLTLWPIYLQTNFLSPTKNKIYIFKKLLESLVMETYNFCYVPT